MMAVLAKAGFTQSYTYFTWRNTKWEFETYLTQLTQTEMKDFFRELLREYPGYSAVFSSARWAPAFPHSGGSRGHAFSGLWDLQRVRALRACAHSGKEEYYDSEKYQFKGRNWDAPATSRSISPS